MNRAAVAIQESDSVINVVKANATRPRSASSFLSSTRPPLVAGSHSISNITKPLIQTKLKIGTPNDKYEQEADRVAEQVMQMPEPRPSSGTGVLPPPNNGNAGNGLVQRTCASCTKEYQAADKEDRPVISVNLCPKCRVQSKTLENTPAAIVQRQNSEEEEELLQAKTNVKSVSGNTDKIVNDVQSLQGHGRTLSRAEQDFFEPRFRTNFSRVRIYEGREAAHLASGIGARAFTLGRDIVLGSGQYKPETKEGYSLMAHELTHALQQRNASKTSTNPVRVSPAEGATEKEAAIASKVVMEGKTVPTPSRSKYSLSLLREGEPISETRVELGQCQPTRINLDPSSLFPPWQNPPGNMSVANVENISNNEKRVILTTGERYRVRRVPWTREERVGPSVRARPGINQEQVWIEVSWCEGSRSEGSVRVGANVPQQAIQLLVRTISNGGDINQAWQQATITPTISGQFRVGSWTIAPSVGVTLDNEGRPTGGNVGLTIRFGRSTPRPPCRRRVVRAGFRYECVQEVNVPAQTRPGRQSRTAHDRRVHNLFFNYARDTFANSRNARGVAGIRTALQQGFLVRRIEGFASPEGSLEETDNFMGNQELSRQRAVAAQRRVAELCGDNPCFTPDLTVGGRGERLDVLDAEGRPTDVFGAELEEHVEQTFPTDPRESPVRTRAVRERLRRARSRRGRIREIYPRLRRAEVTLTRTQVGDVACTFTIPAHRADTIAMPCPPSLINAAFPQRRSTP